MAFINRRNWLGLRTLGRRAARKRSFPLQVEMLEQRDCPTLTIGLPPAQDTGPSNTDKYSSFTTPTLQGITTNNGTFPTGGSWLFIAQQTDGSDPTFIGNAPVPTGSGPNYNWSYAITPALTAGHVYKFFVVDGLTNEANANPDVVIDLVENAPTGLTLTPASDSGVAGDGITNVTTPTITGLADPSVYDLTVSSYATKITLYDTNGTTVIGSATNAVEATAGAWSVTVTTPLSEGVHQIKATATDNAGNVSVLSSSLSITIDTTAPAAPTGLTLDASTDSGVLGDNITKFTQPKINGTADPGTTVQLFKGTTALTPTAVADNTGHWSITLTAALPEGLNNLTAKASDVAGNTSGPSSTLGLTIDTTAPAAPTGLTLDPSTDSGTVGANVTNVNQPNITGSAEAGSTVQLFKGATALTPTAVADVNGNWAITLDTALPDGLNNLTAKATDAAGNVGSASAALGVIVDTVAPAAPAGLLLDSSTDSGALGDNLTNFTHPKIDGTAETGSTVTLLEGTTVLGTATAVGGNWSITVVPALGNGVHNLTAKATDTA